MFDDTGLSKLHTRYNTKTKKWPVFCFYLVIYGCTYLTTSFHENMYDNIIIIVL